MLDDATTTTVRHALERIRDEAAAALALLPVSRRIVRAGENLQAALDQGGAIELEPATWEGTFLAHVPGTQLFGGSAALHGVSGPAIKVPPGAHDIAITLGSATTAWPDCPVLVGDNNDAQTTLDAVPRRITLQMAVPTHRGKRGFYINGAEVTLGRCVVADTYDPGGQDSQAILIANTPGPVSVLGGTFEAGSEIILVGGTGLAIPGIVPADLLFDGVTLARPMTWQTDGIPRKVKNCLELKAGQRVTVRNATLDGCWKQGQEGFALVMTPRNGHPIRDVLVEDVTIRNCSSVLQLMGFNDSSSQPQSEQTTNVTLRRVRSQVTKALGGAGRLVQWSLAPFNLHLEECEHQGDGSSTVYTYGGTAPDIGALTQTFGFRMTRCKTTFGSYGLNTNGNPYGRQWQTALPDGVISGNTLVGAAAETQKNLPDNAFLDVW